MRKEVKRQTEFFQEFRENMVQFLRFSLKH